MLLAITGAPITRGQRAPPCTTTPARLEAFLERINRSHNAEHAIAADIFHPSRISIMLDAVPIHNVVGADGTATEAVRLVPVEIRDDELARLWTERLQAATVASTRPVGRDAWEPRHGWTSCCPELSTPLCPIAW